MRFMMIMFPGPVAETGKIPDSKQIETMMKYNHELVQAGVLLAVDGLKPSKDAARVRVRAGKKQIVDGPFTESKEIVGGYWLINVRSREEALQWASRIPLESEHPDAFVEIRQVFEKEDFPQDAQKLWKDDLHRS
jgi:hypothetical protein